MDWDKLKIFHTVAEASSFTKASTILNLSQSAISRQIQGLETDLKVQLFERHARGLVLTENGEYLFKSAHEVISKLKDVESNLSGHKDNLNGKLIVTTVVSFGTTWLTPRIKEFMDLHPGIEIELIFDDRELDLATREADVAIRMRRPKQLNLIQKKFVDFNYHIYGSNEYLEKNDESSIKRPDHCGLYILVPHSVEFWLERDNRTHERRKYFLDENGWNSCLLSP